MIFSLVLFLFYLLTVIVGGPSRKMKMKKRCMMKHRRFIMGKIDPFYLYSSSCSASETIIFFSWILIILCTTDRKGTS